MTRFVFCLFYCNRRTLFSFLLQFSTLFASHCDLKVILNMWDVYLQQGDQFLVFFMALVIVVNARFVYPDLSRFFSAYWIVIKARRFGISLMVSLLNCPLTGKGSKPYENRNLLQDICPITIGEVRQ